MTEVSQPQAFLTAGQSSSARSLSPVREIVQQATSTKSGVASTEP